MPDARIAFRPFAEQLEFFRRKVNVPSARWDDLLRGDHAHGFMVAGLARMDVLDELRDALTRAIADGETLADFRKRFDGIVSGRWEGFAGDGSAKGRAWRTNIIYRTNLRTSYAAGRWETLRKFRFLRYNHHTLLNPREHHVAWDDLILPADDPWWGVHYPPNGWGCNCDVTGVSDQRLRALGRGVDRAPATVDGDPPPEWAYHVGHAARSLPVASAFGERVMRLPHAWRDATLRDALTRTDDYFAEWPAMLGVLGDALSTIPSGWAAPVGFLRQGVAARLPGAHTALLAIDRAPLAAAQADAALMALLPDAMQRLPQSLASPRTSLYIDGVATAFVAAQRTASGEILAWTFASGDNALSALWLRSVTITTTADLRRLTLIEGEPL